MPLRGLPSLSLRGKLLLISLSVLGLGGLGGAWLVIDSYRGSMLEAARSANDALASTIAEYGAAPLVFEDVAGGDEILGKLASNADVMRATLFDRHGKVFARYERPQLVRVSSGESLLARRPVVHQGKVVGNLVLESSTVTLQERTAAVAERIVLQILLLIALCVLLALRLQLVITEPLARLERTMQRVGAQGELEPRVYYKGNDEIAALYRRFNSMLDQLEDRARERDRTQLWLRTLVESMPDQVLVFNAEGQVIEVRSDLSQPPRLSRGRSLDSLLPSDAAETLRAAATKTLAQREPLRIEYRLGEGDQHFEAVLTPLEDHGATEGFRVLAVSRDVTERDRLQEQFLRSQKLEAVGQLASGVAHDFNNLLSGIMGYAELIKAGHGPRYEADQILHISTRASELVKQLLAFSRKEPSQRRPVEVGQAVQRVAGILRRTLDPRIQLSVKLSAEPCTVKADAAQLESAFLNLAVNARDAMPDGGTLSVEVRPVSLDAPALRALDATLRAGEYVEISVADTGRGIPPEVLGRIFEPFFTTKEAGKGTGLGLSAVYGTARAHEGAVHVQSEVSKGSTFRLLLPRAADGSEALVPPEPRSGSGRLLVLDDELAVLEPACALLRSLGYAVDAFSSPLDALAYFAQHHAQIDGVILDMIMPELTGAQVVERLRKIAPKQRVLLISGFLGSGSELPPSLTGVPILRKPFTKSELAEAAQDLLSSTVEPAFEN